MPVEQRTFVFEDVSQNIHVYINCHQSIWFNGNEILLLIGRGDEIDSVAIYNQKRWSELKDDSVTLVYWNDDSIFINEVGLGELFSYCPQDGRHLNHFKRWVVADLIPSVRMNHLRNAIQFEKYKQIISDHNNIVQMAAIQRENDTMHTTIKLYCDIVAAKESELVNLRRRFL